MSGLGHERKLLRSVCHSSPGDKRQIQRHDDDDAQRLPPPARRCQRKTSLHPAESPGTLFAVFSNHLGEIHFALRYSLMDPDPAIIQHRWSAFRRAKREFLRSFADLKFGAWTQPIPRP